jgi:hypothetical protein
MALNGLKGSGTSAIPMRPIQSRSAEEFFVADQARGHSLTYTEFVHPRRVPGFAGQMRPWPRISAKIEVLPYIGIEKA